MTKKKDEVGAGPGESELALAAAAVDQELRRFEQLSAAARRVPLNSQKNLERAARATQEAAESQERVGVQLHALIAAINAARDRNQATSDAIQARAREIQERQSELAELLRRFASIGEEAGVINGLVQSIATKPADGSPNGSGGPAAQLQEVLDRMARVVEDARRMTEAAEAAGMVDLARQADALRQMVLAARNKVMLLQRSLETNRRQA